VSYEKPFMKEALKDHVLYEHEVTGEDKEFRVKGLDIRYFTLCRPKHVKNSYYYWCDIIFTRVGIIISGDFKPTDAHGIVSVQGYGPSWFGGQLSEDYLGEKFLQKKWTRERAADWCRWHAKDIKNGNEEAPEEAPNVKKWRETKYREFMELADKLEGLSIEEPEAFRTALGLLDYHDWEDFPGWGYDLNEAGWLCALQRAFAREYKKIKQETTA